MLNSGAVTADGVAGTPIGAAMSASSCGGDSARPYTRTSSSVPSSPSPARERPSHRGRELGMIDPVAAVDAISTALRYRRSREPSYVIDRCVHFFSGTTGAVTVNTYA